MSSTGPGGLKPFRWIVGYVPVRGKRKKGTITSAVKPDRVGGDPGWTKKVPWGGGENISKNCLLREG